MRDRTTDELIACLPFADRWPLGKTLTEIRALPETRRDNPRGGWAS